LPKMPRDNMLRGRFRQAEDVLNATRREVPKQKERLKDKRDIEQQVLVWRDKMTDALAAESRAEAAGNKADGEAARAAVAKINKEHGGPLGIWVEGNVADSLGAEVTYLMALCKHEQAERLQTRLDLAGRAGKPPPAEDREAARKAWKDAAGWW